MDKEDVVCMCVHTHTHKTYTEYYLAIKKNVALSFAVTWINLGGALC